ncbi:hypothetical protein EV401DRAFT_1922586, partial [Pisolithus croceorrhizus]
MGRNALKSTARGWQSIRLKPSVHPQSPDSNAGIVSNCQTTSQGTFQNATVKTTVSVRLRLCECIGGLLEPRSLFTDSYLIFPIRGDYFQAQPTWNPVLQVLPRYPLLQTWPTDLGIVAPRALFVSGFRNCMILVVFWLIQSSHGRQGATHNTVHSKAMTFSAWKWGVYEQTRGC